MGNHMLCALKCLTFAKLGSVQVIFRLLLLLHTVHLYPDNSLCLLVLVIFSLLLFPAVLQACEPVHMCICEEIQWVIWVITCNLWASLMCSSEAPQTYNPSVRQTGTKAVLPPSQHG